MALTSVWITGDQCTPHHSALATLERESTVVLMIESFARAAQMPYHKHKLVLIFATMRGFADDLRAAGWNVDYYAAREDFEGPLEEHIARFRPARFAMMAQSEYGVTERMCAAVAARGCETSVTPHANFISVPEDFAALYADGRSRVTMETFYRAMRRKTGILMDGAQPCGGTWNFDKENRRPPVRGMDVPPDPALPEREHVRAVRELVASRFAAHPGSVEGFALPTTRADALAFAEEFFANRLDRFGPYEDAMVTGEPRLFHSKLSAAVNVGLLHPLELAERAEFAYRTGEARLQSAEGFVRQLIGWREFVWQTYWRFMPEYRTRNALDARLPVPAFWHDGETSMRCQREVLGDVIAGGWTHHIGRLMVLGNFALLAGCEPIAVNDWFWAMFVDGYDWVMVPNVIGMTLHADGGVVGTKPYAGSANYINRMSDYCGGCAYDPKSTTGERACPYNALYWEFIDRNAGRFESNPRMQMPVRAWRARDADARDAIRKRAAELRERIAAGERL